MRQLRLQRHVLACPSRDGAAVVPVVPFLACSNAGEDAADGADVGFEDRGDEDSGTEEELRVDRCEGGVGGELPGQGAEDGRAGGAGAVEERVHVGKEGVADGHCVAGGGGDVGPY